MKTIPLITWILLFAATLSASWLQAKAETPAYKLEAFSFLSVKTAEPGVYDADNESDCSDASQSALSLGIHCAIPKDGVRESTGLIVYLDGIGSSDCPELAGDFEMGSLRGDPVRTAWIAERDVVYAQIFYRNSQYLPYDFGKYQAVDVLRGIGAILERYPMIDRRRMYLLGESSGGQLALHMMLVRPDLFAEVYALGAISRISTHRDTLRHGYLKDLYKNPQGYSSYMMPQFPVIRPDEMKVEEHERKLGEIKLRSPQWGLSWAAPVSEDSPLIFVAHARGDGAVSYKHFQDLMSAIERATNQKATKMDLNSWQIRNWSFLRLSQGDHDFKNGPEDCDSFSKAIVKMNPNAFLHRRDEIPTEATDVQIPPQMDWTYHYKGDTLLSTTMETEWVR